MFSDKTGLLAELDIGGLGEPTEPNIFNQPGELWGWWDRALRGLFNFSSEAY
jgi:hypothetical protein